MNKFLFIIGQFHSLLILQGKKWKDRISKPLRFICYWGFTVYAGAIAYHLSQLPDGSVEYMLSHFCEPLGAFLLVTVTVFSMIGAGSIVAAGKFKATL